MTPFALDGGIPLALTRASAVIALLAQFGAVLSVSWLAPLRQRLERLALVLLLASVVATLLWLAAETRDIAGSLAALPLVLEKTLFGHLVLVRLTLLCLVALAIIIERHNAATLLAAAALVTQAGHDHAWAMYDGPSLLLLSTAAHLLAAGAWLGGLPPLAILVASLPPAQAAQAAYRFSHLATACVLTIAVTAMFQAAALIGTPARLLDTAYGLTALAKLALFTALLALAAFNRFHLTPALTTTFLARRALLRSLALETALGLLVIFAAALLTSLPPSMQEPL